MDNYDKRITPLRTAMPVQLMTPDYAFVSLSSVKFGAVKCH